jgi:hypothetical protein
MNDVLNQDTLGSTYCDVARHTGRLEPLTWLWSGFADTSGLVIQRWVEDQLPDEFPGSGVVDANIAAVDQHQDRGSGVGSSDADVVKSAVVAEGEFAVAVDYITADPGLRLGLCGAWRGGFGSDVVGRQPGRTAAISVGATLAAPGATMGALLTETCAHRSVKTIVVRRRLCGFCAVSSGCGTALPSAATAQLYCWRFQRARQVGKAGGHACPRRRPLGWRHGRAHHAGSRRGDAGGCPRSG